MTYERNHDPEYYESHRNYANCGSFALNLKGWYDPEDYFYDREGYAADWIEELYTNGYNEEEISNLYAEILVEGMLEEFRGELRELTPTNWRINPSEELVEFRTFCYYDEEGCANWDFHFKVLRDGLWMEKNGSGPVHCCEEDEWGDYISDTFYFAHWLL